MAKIFVGLSGGVDSAVSAALLKEAGHSITGVFIRIYRPEFLECTWREDRLDAMRVSAALSIPFREIDLSEEYKRSVVDAMIADYRSGVTPNPDVLCNRTIKFGSFLSWARSEGAEAIATGHYARIEHDKRSNRLLRGLDQRKDQSYFLYRLTAEDLNYVHFPVGALEKKTVRQKAALFGLPVANKRDSQGICFIGDVSLGEFLKRYIDLKPGLVIDRSGAIIGGHDGAALLTIGQRHGFTLRNDGAGLPQYVVALDTASNTVTVSPHKEDAATVGCRLKGLSWVGDPPQIGQSLLAQARYREAPVTAMVTASDETSLELRFDQPHIAPPGQSLVLYQGATVLGGGLIEKQG